MFAHPYGVEPEGNLYLQEAGGADGGGGGVRGRGLGLLRVLSDELVLEVLGFADGASLSALCVASGALRCFASFEELWKGVALRRAEAFPQLSMRYSHGSWKAAVLGRGRGAAAEGVRKRLCSDVLYHPWRLFSGGSPLGGGEGGAGDEIHGSCASLGACPRAPAGSMSVGRFVEEHDKRRVPLVLEQGCGQVASNAVWDRAELLRRFGERRFHVGGHAFDLKGFLEYAQRNSDEQPLYLFDSRFGQAAPELLKEYAPAKYFADDLLDLLPEEGPGRRPDKRWIIIGGARSGSAWHVDPNGCSAWNANLRGRKRWLFFPPGITPPGVRRSEDGQDLVAPVSLAEWSHAFYGAARAHPLFMETVTGPGDLVFIPRGWWHSVVNLDDYTVALTHNFCSPAGLSSTLGLLRSSPHLVAGLSAERDDRQDECDGVEEAKRREAVGIALHARFFAALKQQRPAELAAAEAKLTRPKSLWAQMTGPPNSEQLGGAVKGEATVAVQGQAKGGEGEGGGARRGVRARDEPGTAAVPSAKRGRTSVAAAAPFLFNFQP